MKRTILKVLAIGIVGLPLAAVADSIDVTYDVGAYAPGGFSASWLHSATGCPNTGPSGATLYMCDNIDDIERIGGTISGLFNDELGLLSGISGSLTTASGVTYSVLGGSLGGNDTWEITIAVLGRFVFEAFDWGTGKPNNVDGTEFILWGQNEAAYSCSPQVMECAAGPRWGLDLYGAAAARVPEPGTLALFGIGLLGLGMARRRKT